MALSPAIGDGWVWAFRWVAQLARPQDLAGCYGALLLTPATPERDALLASIEARLWCLTPVGRDPVPAPLRLRIPPATGARRRRRARR